jgi:UDP-glucuronate 4-epimerase
MKIIITGCCGFIGSHLCDFILKNYQWDVFGIDNIKEDRERKKINLAILNKYKRFQFEEGDICSSLLIEKCRPDIVVHLAGLAGVRNSNDNPEKYIYNNLIGHTYLLKNSIQYRVKKFIYASSSSVYGSNNKKPFSENDRIDDVESPYALSKWACEKMSKIYANNEHTEIIGCRFFSVYGPRGRPDMAPFKFYNLIKNDEVIEIYGDGLQERDFTYIDDVIQCILRIIFSKKKLNPIINIGYGQPITILMLIHVLEDLLGKKSKIKFLPRNTLDVPITHCDTSNLQSQIEYIPQFNIQQGLYNMIQYHNQ